MNAGRRALHLVRTGDPGPDREASPDSVHPLPDPKAARAEDWDRVVDLIFDHDVTVVW